MSPDRLVRNPADEFEDMRGICLSAVLPGLTHRNMSVSGSALLEHIETIRRDVKVQDWVTLGIVVMTTGGNDIIHNYGRTEPSEGAMYGATLAQARPWVEAFQRRLGKMVGVLPPCTPVLFELE